MLKTLLTILAGFLEVLIVFVAAEAELRKRPKGKAVLDLVETGTVRFTEWRANADVVQEMRRIRRFCGLVFLATLILIFTATAWGLRWVSVFLLPTLLISLLGHLSLEWTINWRSVLKVYGGLFLMTFAVVPFAYHLKMPEYEQFAALSVLSARLLGAGNLKPSPMLATLVPAGMFLFALIIMSAVAVLVSGSIAAPLWVTFKASDLFRRRFNRDVLFWTTLTVQILVIVLACITNLM